MSRDALSKNVANALKQALERHQVGRLQEAEALYRQILAREPCHFEALLNLGLARAQGGDFAEARKCLEAAAGVRPDVAEVQASLGHVQLASDNPEAALLCYERALAIRAQYPEAWYGHGNTLMRLRRHEEAVASYDKALGLAPGRPEVLTNRGNALHDLKRYDEALASYDQALALMPGVAMLHNNRGNTLRELKRCDEALASLDRALAIEPDYADALNNRGIVLQDLGRCEEALACFDKVLAMSPDLFLAHNCRGNVLHDLKRYEEAIASYGRALHIKPDYAEAIYNQGNVMLDLLRFEEALTSYDRALALNPGYAEALNNRGNALRDLGRHEEAARSFARLLEIAPDWGHALGEMFHSQLLYCNWAQYAQTAGRIVQAVNDGKKAETPLPFLAISQSAAGQLLCARAHATDKYPSCATPMWTGRRYQHDKIRVAYLSADFCEHAVSFLMAGLFERHDRSRFETMAISFRPEDQSSTGRRVKTAFDRFTDVSRISDRDVAALLRDLEVDVAVDLMGFTFGSRTAIFSHRPAPIQVNYLGFPGTMGAGYMDYILADRFVIPEHQQPHYAEKVVHLPDCFQANDGQRRIGEPMPTRADVGLPESGLVFCSFNNTYKLNPPFFDAWMRLLQAVPGSVLWLVADDVSARNLRAEAVKRSVDPGRLIFAPRLPYADHLARFQLADLFLDTLPFNAGTTASDALWAGVPVLTCAGEAFASRMAGSLLHAIGLPELITHNLEEYEALALDLATHPDRLATIRAKLAEHRATYPLFDTDRFRRHIEAAYITMWERHQRGEPPQSFAVEAIA